MRVAMSVLREFGVVAAGGEGAPLKVMRSNEALRFCSAIDPVRQNPSPRPSPGGRGRQGARARFMTPLQGDSIAIAFADSRQHGQWVEGTAQDGAWGDGQPAVEDRGVDAPEVDRMTRIAVVQVSKIGIGPVQAGLHGTAQQKDRRCGAMVCAGAAVFIQPAAELGEDQDQHAIGFTRFLQVVKKGSERSARWRMRVACDWS